jgi:hypothetical protein
VYKLILACRKYVRADIDLIPRRVDDGHECGEEKNLVDKKKARHNRNGP